MAAFEQVDQLIRQGFEQGAYPCAAVAAGIGQTLYLKQTYGSCVENTLFDMASVSKVLAPTMIALRFLEDGLLRLYDCVGDYFPGAPDDKKNITILQLLTHTGGFAPHFYLSECAAAPKDGAKAILEHPLAYTPGGDPSYSCMGFILLGKILEKIGGASLDILAQKYVFEPLGMEHTSYHPSGDIAPTEMDPETGKLLQGVVHDENARFLGGISANAGVFSDLNDMIRFAQMLAMNGRLPDKTWYLSPTTMKAARTNHTPGSRGEFRGLGFNLAGSPKNFLGDLMGAGTYGHTGFTGTSIAVDPDTGLWVVLLTNRVCPTRNNTQLVRMRSLIHNAAAAEAGRLLAENK